MRIFGAQLVVSTSEDGLWWDSDHPHEYTNEPRDEGGGKRGWGLVVKLRGGHVVRPFPHPKWWFRGERPNVWFDQRPDARLFVMRFFCPAPVLPYVSVALGRFGLYLGFKASTAWHPQYKAWLPEAEVHDRSRFLTPSATIRRTRVR